MDKEEKDNSKNNMHNNKEDDSNNSNNSNKENRNKNAKDNSKSIESLQKNHYQNHRKRVRKRRVIFLGSLFIILLLLFIFGTKSYLYFNFLIGNDIIIKLDVSQENFNLQHGQEGILNFKSSATTNPFCTASCTAKFEDLSSAEKNKEIILFEEYFNLNPTQPYQNELNLSSEEKIGYNLYRLDLSCISISTNLCHTNEKPTTRKVLITVNYSLNEEEKKQHTISGQEILSAYQNIQEISNTIETIKASSPLSTGEFGEEWNKNKIIIEKELELQTQLWSEQKVKNINLNNINKKIELLSNKSQEEVARISKEHEEYNKRVELLNNASTTLEKMRDFIVYSTEIEILADEINSYAETNQKTVDITAPTVNSTVNSTPNIFLDLNETTANTILRRTTLLFENLNNSHHQELLIRERKLNLLSTAICGDNCSWKNNIKQDSGKNSSWNSTCKQISLFLESSGNKTLAESIVNVSLLNQTITELNLTTSEAEVAINKIISPCVFNIIKEIRLPEKKVMTFVKTLEPFYLPEIKEQCCIWGRCEPCRDTSEKENVLETGSPETPIVFLHGHAFDKDISYEYSLEGFNKIQEKMENDGIINAGAITLYTPRESQGLWGKFGAVSIKGSYYFDIFSEPENYYVVQTKRENIDTYSIRLKEVIDTITYKTGSKKVKIVAFSMGGLVARRYLQIFGEEQVKRIVTIGTPHQGIEGDILRVCALTGEERECNDMNKNSLFMNKLSRSEVPHIPFKIIYGSGCTMDLGEGDGIVLTKNAQLPGVSSAAIQGQCQGKGSPLHLDLLDIDRYPEVYTIIIEFLKDS